MSISLTGSPSLDALHDPSAAGLKSKAVADPKAALKAAAQQFEALFMQQLMKSMREATVSAGMLDNSGTQLGTELLDGQFANRMTGIKGGLSEAIMRQLERQMSGAAGDGLRGSTAIKVPLSPSAAAGSASAGNEPALTPTQADFVRQHTEAAKVAEAESGIPAVFMVGQAAHESGWGRREIKLPDGRASYNLFGIKAGASWKGPVAEITTTEYVDGQAKKVSAKFRAYSSYAESFRDYAQLMKDNPRYAGVLAAGSNASAFAQGLQRAGYATDPAYAEKLTRVINTALRLQHAHSA